MNEEKKALGLVFVSIIFFGIVIASCAFLSGYYNRETVIDKVLKTDRVVGQTGKSSQYLIFGKHETYSDHDTIAYWKWNSSDLYGAIEPGHTYKFTVYGWRVPFLSLYRNIVDYKEVN